jgi:hypothetical protein
LSRPRSRDLPTNDSSGSSSSRPSTDNPGIVGVVLLIIPP